MAVDYLIQAIELAPECIVYKSHLARVYVRQNRRDAETEGLLLETAEKDDRHGWREWANLQVIKIREKNTRELENTKPFSAPVREKNTEAPGPIEPPPLDLSSDH